ncbi:MAG: HNH endonuclease [Selenomonadaceae bacterium]|nr:HNH endonuclease [Selenomonadaceae bacterium]
MTDKEYWRRRYEEEIKPAYDEFIKLYPFTTDDLDSEIWLPIPDYENYHGSNWGRVKSFWGKEPKILKPTLTRRGYLRVVLYKDGKQKTFLVHVLVARLFIPNPDNLPEVDHRYGMKFDNYVGNLRWATRNENIRYSYDLGLHKSGEDTYQAKLTAAQVLYIRENPDGLNLEQLAEKFGVIFQTISLIQLGKNWKSVGGSIREKRGVSDEEREQILVDYQKGVKGHGYREVAKRFGYAPKTIWRIVNGR